MYIYICICIYTHMYIYIQFTSEVLHMVECLTGETRF